MPVENVRHRSWTESSRVRENQASVVDKDPLVGGRARSVQDQTLDGKSSVASKIPAHSVVESRRKGKRVAYITQPTVMKVGVFAERTRVQMSEDRRFFAFVEVFPTYTAILKETMPVK